MTFAIAIRQSNIVRKFGIAGFLFFLVKGLLWLAAPFVFALFI